MKVEIKIVNITAEYAKELLEKKHDGQLRRLNQNHIKVLANAMATGKWQNLNGDTIVIDTDGRVIDGQHRLWAIIMSNSCITTLLVTGVNPAAFYTLDVMNKPRRIADVLSIEGVNNSGRISTMIRLLINYQYGLPPTVSSRLRITSFDYGEFLNKHRSKLYDSYEKARKARHILPTAAGAFLHFIFAEIDHRLADDFFHAFSKGAGLDVTSPVRILRERLITNKNSTAKLPMVDRLAFSILSWNALRSGKQISFLRWVKSKQEFPRAI